MLLFSQVAGLAQIASHARSDWAWSTPDLDGDARPESARQTSLGWDRNGFGYSVHFQLSNQEDESSIQVHTRDPWAIHLAFRDVDGDQDLDLVVTSGLHHEPLGVWLNTDGHFSPAAANSIPATNWLDENSFESQSAPQVQRLLALPGRTSTPSFTLTSLWPVVWPRACLRAQFTHTVSIQEFSPSSSPRAPPALSSSSISRA